jgi:hypothetical protein
MYLQFMLVDGLFPDVFAACVVTEFSLMFLQVVLATDLYPDVFTACVSK